MRIALFCATQRGLRCLQTLRELVPDADLLVFSFREEPWEPPFLDAIQQAAESCDATFYESKQVARLTDVWESQAVDLMLAISWRYLIPASVHGRARLGAYIIHDSLLPGYRGFSPTVWAMINGENHTGATLLEMVDDYDAGAIIGQERVPIAPDETIADVLEHVTSAYVRLLRAHIPALLSETATRVSQDESLATYTAKLVPDDFRINWAWPTERIYNLIRATTAPYAGAYTTFNGQRLRIWAARRLHKPHRYVGRIPGRVAEIRGNEGVVILTGDGLLLVTEAQLDNGERVPAAQILKRMADTLV
jgi:methionyl-tRNA formyltransferase